MVVQVCVREKGCRKRGGSTASVRVPRHESPQGAGCEGWLCASACGRQLLKGTGSDLCSLQAVRGKRTGAAPLHESACELLQVTGQEWGLWVHGREPLQGAW